jgi:hypothetical protein
MNKSHHSQKPFSRDIEHFRNETEASLSVKDHRAFGGFDPPEAESSCDPAKGR